MGLGLVLATGLGAQEPGPILSVEQRDGQVYLRSGSTAGSVLTLLQSTNLSDWRSSARVHDSLKPFPVGTLGSPGARGEFFRLVARPRSLDDDWKNQMIVPGDAFLSDEGGEGAGGLSWIKWMIDLAEPDRVYFQDGGRYLFHYEFASRRVPAVAGMTPDEFDAVSLFQEGQRYVLGAVVFPRAASVAEGGIQIVGREPFPVQQVARWFKTVRAAVDAPAGFQLFYLPTYEQGGLTESEEAVLSAAGIEVTSPARWVRSDECYSGGWAFGRLAWVPSWDIQTAFTEGRLLYSDILLTDAVPAEIPLVAGVISLSPATPNSHVAILARSFGVPFVHVADTGYHERLRGWGGRQILLVTEPREGGCLVRSLEVEGRLSESQRQQLVQAKRLPPLEINAKSARGVLSVPVREAWPADIRHIGGKAANLGLVIRSVPAHADTNAIAFTFDLWDGFLDQRVQEGGTLREVIQTTLSRHRFPPNMKELSKDLAGLRARIRTGTDFSAAQKEGILAALTPFDRVRKLRFRSSTNVEDSEMFSGAGLYDSYSGCLADDMDGDEAGPSRCDPGEANERGVFRALRRVYASFYNDNAFLERLRHGVAESEVGMAVLVHPSAPDETEMANGVATVQVRRSPDSPGSVFGGELVTQAGAVSVSNPEPNALPEVVLAEGSARDPVFRRARGSSLLPLGRSVLGWTGEYGTLYSAFDTVAQAWFGAHPSRVGAILDFEYKKLVPGRLLVKQVREVPQGVSGTNPPPFTLNDAGRLVAFQHHGKDLLANHRLKSIWQFRSLVFAGEGALAGLDFEVDVTYHDGLRNRSYSGPMSGLPGARTQIAGSVWTHDWVWGEGEFRRDMRLSATFPSALNAARPRSLSEATLVELSARYARPQAWFGDLGGTVKEVTQEATRFVPLDRVTEGTLNRRRTFRRGNVQIEVDYTLAFLKFGVAGIGIFDGKSFPLVRWGTTKIRGLTSQPMEVQGEFARTYDSNRHNFQETFFFEPALDPSQDPGVLAELKAANVKAVGVTQFTASEGTSPSLWIWGFDGRWREVRP